MSRQRGHNASVDVVATCLISVPQVVACIGKSAGVGLHGRIQSFAMHHVDEGQVHVEVVVQVGPRLEHASHHSLRPFDAYAVINHSALITELRRATIRTADGLSCPTAFDFVHQAFLADGDALGHSLQGERQRNECNKDMFCFHVIW